MTDPLQVAGAVAMTPDRHLRIDDPERGQLVGSLWDTFDHLEKVTELDRVEIADLLGCDSPEPSLWLSAPLDTLRRSHQIVTFLFRQVNPPDAVAPDRETGRIALLTGVETIARCRGNVAVAEYVMVEPGTETGESPVAMLHAGRMGRARRLIVNRVGALAAELAVSREAWRPPTGSEQDLALEIAKIQDTAFGLRRSQ